MSALDTNRNCMHILRQLDDVLAAAGMRMAALGAFVLSMLVPVFVAMILVPMLAFARRFVMWATLRFLYSSIAVNGRMAIAYTVQPIYRLQFLRSKQIHLMLSNYSHRKRSQQIDDKYFNGAFLTTPYANILTNKQIHWQSHFFFIVKCHLIAMWSAIWHLKCLYNCVLINFIEHTSFCSVCSYLNVLPEQSHKYDQYYSWEQRTQQEK